MISMTCWGSWNRGPTKAPDLRPTAWRVLARRPSGRRAAGGRGARIGRSAWLIWRVGPIASYKQALALNPDYVLAKKSLGRLVSMLN